MENNYIKQKKKRNMPIEYHMIGYQIYTQLQKKRENVLL